MTTVTLCICKDDPRKISKSTSGDSNRNCEIYGECSIHNPQILLAYSDDIKDYNYAKMLNRQYWVKDIILMPGKRCELILQEDVLSTHAEEILKINKFRAIRNEYVGQPLIYDSEYPTRVDNVVDVKHFSAENVFNNFNYLVTVLGGVQS